MSRFCCLLPLCLLWFGISHVQSIQSKQVCKEKVADVVFLLDSSHSIGMEEFNTQLTFVSQLVRSFTLGPQHMQVGVLTFSTRVRLDVALSGVTSKQKLLEDIARIQYMAGGTRTADAIHVARTTMTGFRSVAEHILILITDGHSFNKHQTAMEAALARNEGMRIFAIGVGSDVDQRELREIASDPDDSHVFHVQSYDALQSIKGSLTERTCQNLVCKEKVADVVFLLDSSHSIGMEEFNTQLTFVSQLVRSFTLGPQHMQVGVLTFSTKVRLDVALSGVTSKQKLLEDIAGIQYMAGGTRTAYAIHVARTTMTGFRSVAEHILILITDGHSFNKHQTAMEATLARSEGMRIFAIGVGSDVDQRELQEIASDPDDSHVFHVQSYDALQSIKGSLTERTCQNPVCKEKMADVVFLLDSSHSIGMEEFNTQLTFISQLVRSFTLGPQHMQVGVLTFSTRVRLEVALSGVTSKQRLLEDIARIQYMAGGTRTAYAIHVARTTMTGFRSVAEHILILITDGHSFNKHQTAMEATLARSEGMRIFAIGVGSEVDQRELREIASDPDDSHVFHVQSYDALQSIKGSLTERTCQNLVCKEKMADVVFLLDSSHSIGMEEFNTQLTFVSQLVRNFTLGPQHMQVGVLTFSTKVRLDVALSGVTSKQRLLEDIAYIQYMAGGTRTADAIHVARTTMTGFRSVAEHILILITDGHSFNKHQTAMEAALAKREGMRIFAIGVGSDVDQGELREIASDPDDSHVFHVQSYDALQSIKGSLTERTCQNPVNGSTVSPTKDGKKGGNTVDEDDAVRCEDIAIQRCSGNPADIYFLLDSSTSINRDEFQEQIQFVSHLLEVFDVGAEKTRVGVALFTNDVHNLVSLTDNQNAHSIWQTLTRAPIVKGETNTSEALRYVRTQGFSVARDNAAHVIIVVTNGLSYDRQRTKQEAQAAHREGIYVFAVGVGSSVDLIELMDIASDPDNFFMHFIQDFQGLQNIKDLLAVQTCVVPPRNTNRGDQPPQIDYSTELCTP